MTATSRLRSTVHSHALAVAALVVLGSTGCAFHVVHTPPLSARDLGTGEIRVVHYPAYVLVHDEQSDWDAHQIKNNVVGLFDGELIGWVDLVIDQGIPARDARPLQRGIEWTKNTYAQLPDIAPVRIVGGFFSALGIEKTTILGGVRIAKAPGDPISYFAFLRAIYLTDWLQDTLGEANTGLGHLVPWKGSFVPAFVTAPINDVADWAQYGAVTGYIYVFREIDIGLDNVLYAGEWLWGGLVSLFVDDAEPVNQSTSQAGPDSP
jgi:hypothetical protein